MFAKRVCFFQFDVDACSITIALAVASACFAIAVMPIHAQIAEPQGSIITSQGVVLDAKAHKAYVVDTKRDVISVVDTDGRSQREVRVGKNPIAIALNPVTHRIYVANHGSGTVSVLSGAGQMLATVAVDPLPYSIAVDPATNQAFVSSVYSNAIKIIDGATGAVTSLQGVSADAMSLDSSRGQLYLLSYESSQLSVLDIASHAFRKLPMGGTHLWALAGSPAGVLYVTRVGSADVVAYHQKTGASDIIKTGNYPCAIAINASAGKLYVVNYADHSVTVIDAASNHALITLPVGDHPQAVAVNETADEAYVVNTHSNSITVVDGRTNKVVRTVPVGTNPYAVVADPQTGVLVTANEGEPSFSRVETVTAPAKTPN